MDLFSILGQIVNEGITTETVSILVVFCIILLAPNVVPKMIELMENRRYGKKEDKAKLGWIKKRKNERTHIDILLGQYRRWAAICFGCLFLHVFCLKWNINYAGTVVCLLLSCRYVKNIYDNQWEEIKKNKHTKISSIIIGTIFIVTYGLATKDNYLDFAQILFYISIVLWCVYILYEWEAKYTYEYEYVDVESKESGLIKNVRVMDIKKYNGWIGLPVNEEKVLKEICIKKDDIKRIIYHGTPITIITKNRYIREHSREEIRSI